MKNIYIVYDDVPYDWGEKSILNVYTNKEGAKKFISRMKQKNEYENQYLTVVIRKLR